MDPCPLTRGARQQTAGRMIRLRAGWSAATGLGWVGARWPGWRARGTIATKMPAALLVGQGRASYMIARLVLPGLVSPSEEQGLISTMKPKRFGMAGLLAAAAGNMSAAGCVGNVKGLLWRLLACTDSVDYAWPPYTVVMGQGPFCDYMHGHEPPPHDANPGQKYCNSHLTGWESGRTAALSALT
jgi:hypothetical protein